MDAPAGHQAAAGTLPAAPVTRSARTWLAAAIAWVPLLALSWLVDRATTADIQVPFLWDIGAHVRLLVAMPLYLAVGKYIDPAIRGMVAEFLKRRLVADEAGFRKLVRRMDGLAASRVMWGIIIGIAFVRGLISAALENNGSWVKSGPDLQLSAAGWWYAVVSLPLLFSISGRWVWKVLIWTYFLASVSRLPLRLVPTHPDGAGGLGFIGLAHSRLAFLVCIANAGLSAKIAVDVLLLGNSLSHYRVGVGAVIAVEIALLLAPLIPFVPMLMRLRREGSMAYGRLGMTYVRQFADRWAPPAHETENTMLGTPDIQSLADLASSYAVIEQTRVLLVTRRDLIKMIGLAILPFLPLALTVMSFGELLQLGKSVLV